MKLKNVMTYIRFLEDRIFMMDKLIEENPDPNDKYFSFLAQRHCYEDALINFQMTLKFEKEEESWSITNFIKEMLGIKK